MAVVEGLLVVRVPRRSTNLPLGPIDIRKAIELGILRKAHESLSYISPVFHFLSNAIPISRKEKMVPFRRDEKANGLDNPEYVWYYRRVVISRQKRADDIIDGKFSP